MIRVIWADELRIGHTLLVACGGAQCRIHVEQHSDTGADHQLDIRKWRLDGPYMKVIAVADEQEVGWGERASEPVRIRTFPAVPALALPANDVPPKPGPRPGPVGR